MGKERAILKKKYYLLALVIVAGFLAYLIGITKSALWYDEAVEYFYSKVAYGEVPGGFGTTNMYERIVFTYQPPLYNVLMYVWLRMFDSGEFSFRLAGILVTLAGAIGFYRCMNELCGVIYAAIGTSIYVFASGVAYYALECGEYNLVLCCICWTMYFFVKYRHDEKTSSLTGFFAFACLSVYSQYGAAFLIFALYAAVLIDAIKNKKNLIKLLLATGIVFVFAVIPLVLFFLFPQMSHQGSRTVTHSPVFQSNVAVDYIRGLRYIAYEIFIGHTQTAYLKALCLAFVLAALMASIYALKQKERDYRTLIAVSIATYTIYFIAVACSFYGYNNWNGTLGCFNLGGRYCLFFAPVVLVVLTYGIKIAIGRIARDSIRKHVFSALMVSVLIFCLAEAGTLVVGYHKDDVREATAEWYKNKAYSSMTLVHEWSDANFQFYLTHNKDYDEEFQENILAAERWTAETTYDEIQNILEEIDVFALDSFYYLGPTNRDSIFVDLMEDNGYEITVLYSNMSELLYLEK